MDGIEKLLSESYIKINGSNDDDNEGVKLKYVDEKAIMKIFHGFSKDLLKFLDLGIIEWHVRNRIKDGQRRNVYHHPIFPFGHRRDKFFTK